jgi:hypothetical protein
MPPFLVCLQKREPAYFLIFAYESAFTNYWRNNVVTFMQFGVKPASCRIWQRRKCQHKNNFILWHVCWKSELRSQQRQPWLRTSSANTPVDSQWLSSRHVIAATDTHAAMEKLLEEMFYVRSMLRLYNEGQLPLRESWDGRYKRRKLAWDGRHSARTWTRKQRNVHL